MKTTRVYSRKKAYVVYALLDTRKPGVFRYGHWVFTHEPFYIGKGTSERPMDHLKHTYRSPKVAKINRIRAAGLEPAICLKRTRLTEKQALRLEVVLIARIGRADQKKGPLTNLTDGGEGGKNLVVSAHTRSLMRANMRRKFRSQAAREVHGQAISTAIKSRSQHADAKWRRNLSAANTRRFASQAARDEISRLSRKGKAKESKASKLRCGRLGAEAAARKMAQRSEKEKASIRLKKQLTWMRRCPNPQTTRMPQVRGAGKC